MISSHSRTKRMYKICRYREYISRSILFADPNSAPSSSGHFECPRKCPGTGWDTSRTLQWTETLRWSTSWTSKIDFSLPIISQTNHTTGSNGNKKGNIFCLATGQNMCHSTSPTQCSELRYFRGPQHPWCTSTTRSSFRRIRTIRTRIYIYF